MSNESTNLYSVIFNTHDVVLIITAYQCVLFAILLLSSSAKRKTPLIFLAFFLLQQAAIPMDVLISFGESFREISLNISPNLFYTFGFGYWLEAPLLLWYTRSLIYKGYRLQLKDAVYVLPFLAYLAYEIVFYYSLNLDEKMRLLQGYDLFVAPKYMNYITFGRELFRAILGVMCLYEIYGYRKRLKDQFAEIDKIDLSWLTILVVGFTILRIWALFVIVALMMSVLWGISTLFEIMGLIGNYITLLLISILIFYGLRNSVVCEGAALVKGDKDSEEKDRITNQQIESLRVFMDTHKPYLTPGLNLDRLAASVSIPPRTLSSIINREFKCNFFEFINTYRIEEAKNLLSLNTSSEKSVLNIMYDVGFNSKATFNTFFKKKLGMTPSEYRKRMA